MRIAVFSTCPEGVYSGGRYHALMVAACLARRGHECYFVSNNIPIFADDLANVSPGNPVRYVKTETFELDPDRRFDAVFVAPQISPHRRLYGLAAEFAKASDAALFLINYETPNWFNSFSPGSRQPSQWDEWQTLAAEGAMILCSAAENQRYARSFYKNLPPDTQFGIWEPAINSAAIEAAGTVSRARRIIVFARPSDAHKGSAEITGLFCAETAPYTFSVVIGNPRKSEEFVTLVEQAAAKAGCKVEFLYSLNDVDKFKLLLSGEALVFPSHFEGYGYPPIEALACDTPVIAYELPILRETCGDRIDYAPLGDIEALRRGLIKLLEAPRGRPSRDPEIRRLTQLDERAASLEKVIGDYREFRRSRAASRFRTSESVTISGGSYSAVAVGELMVAHLGVALPFRIESLFPRNPWATRAAVTAGAWTGAAWEHDIILTGDAGGFDPAAAVAEGFIANLEGGVSIDLDTSLLVRPAPAKRLEGSAGVSRLSQGRDSVSIWGWAYPPRVYDSLFLVDPTGRSFKAVTGIKNDDYLKRFGEKASGACGFICFAPLDFGPIEQAQVLLVKEGRLVAASSIAVAKPKSDTLPTVPEASPTPEYLIAADGKGAGRLSLSAALFGEGFVRLRGWTNVFDKPTRVVVSYPGAGARRQVEVRPNIRRVDLEQVLDLPLGRYCGVEFSLPIGDEETLSTLEFEFQSATGVYEVAGRPKPAGHAPKIATVRVEPAAVADREPGGSSAKSGRARPFKWALSATEYDLSGGVLRMNGWAFGDGPPSVAVHSAASLDPVATTTCDQTRQDVARTFKLAGPENIGFLVETSARIEELSNLELSITIGGQELLRKAIPGFQLKGVKDFAVVGAAYDAEWSTLWVRGFFAHPGVKLDRVEAYFQGRLICSGVTGVKQQRGAERFAGWRIESEVEKLPPGAAIDVRAWTTGGGFTDLRVQLKADAGETPNNDNDFSAAFAREGDEGAWRQLFGEFGDPGDRRVLVVVHNLDAPERPEKLASLNRLAAALAAQGSQLVCLHHSAQKAGGEFAEINFFDPRLDLLIESKVDLELGMPLAFDNELDSGLRDPAIREAARMSYGFLASLNRTPKKWPEVREQVTGEARRLDLVIRALKPAVVLLWHQWNSLAMLGRTACDRLGIPSAFIHEGPVPRTMTIDQQGMMAESDSTGALIGKAPEDGPYREQAQKIIARVAAERLDRKPSLDLPVARSIAAAARARGRPLLFFAGINDWQSGNLPINAASAHHSPHFTDTQDALDALIAAAERNDWLILFKPHPNLYPGNFARTHPRLAVVREASGLDCVEAADATVTILSSLSYIALCHGKPTVLMGRNMLSGTGAAYELSNRADLDHAITAALASTSGTKRERAFADHVAALLKRHLYPYGDGDTFSMRSWDDAADEVLRIAGVARPKARAAAG